MINLKVKFNDKDFERSMKNFIEYSNGFLEGARAGKVELLKTVGEKTVEILNEYIDSNARVNEAALQHVYEWSRSGSPESRLFDLEYTTAGGGLTVRSSFRQSSSVKAGSRTPFYDKARIMEEGVPVVIKPVAAKVLAFEDNGQEVFTRGPVVVGTPGGRAAAGGFKETVDTFFRSYFSQAFLETSGVGEILRNPTIFKQRLARAKAGGRAVGYDSGYRWISARETR
jgi:hypothetical protein